MAEQKEQETESKEVVKASSSNGAESGAYNRSQLPDLLRVYYKWLFPYDKYFEWLQYGEQSRAVNFNTKGSQCCVHKGMDKLRVRVRVRVRVDSSSSSS